MSKAWVAVKARNADHLSRLLSASITDRALRLPSAGASNPKTAKRLPNPSGHPTSRTRLWLEHMQQMNYEEFDYPR